MISSAPIAFSGGGQSLEDKLYAVKYIVSGQAISYVVLKATTSEMLGPKRKHLNYLVNMTNEPNVSIPNLVKHLMIRAKNSEWTIAFKAAITIHHLVTYGNEKFIQNFASSTVNYRSLDKLCSFVDRTTVLAHKMSIFLRRYSRYINSKLQSYRSLGDDFCRIKQKTLPMNSDDCNDQSPISLKKMPLDQLLKVIPIVQHQFDTLLTFDACPDDLCNGIMCSAFNMIYKDFIKLYITYQTAIVRLLELYFKVDRLKQAREMLDIYKKFLIRMDKVSDFMRVVESVGMDMSSMPNVSRAPNLSLKLLETHVDGLEKAASSRRLYETIGRMQSMQLPRLEYSQSFSRNRRRSLRSTSRLQSSIDVLSPVTPTHDTNYGQSGYRPFSAQSTPVTSRKTPILISPEENDNIAPGSTMSNGLLNSIKEHPTPSSPSGTNNDDNNNDKSSIIDALAEKEKEQEKHASQEENDLIQLTKASAPLSLDKSSDWVHIEF